MKMPRAHYTLEYQLIVPADLATIYDLNPAFAAGYTGQGQTIAVLEDSDLYNTADWDTFRQVFGLSTYTSGSLSTINPAPPRELPIVPIREPTEPTVEATLDAEWASAAAPDATIEVAACADTTTTRGIPDRSAEFNQRQPIRLRSSA